MRRTACTTSLEGDTQLVGKQFNKRKKNVRRTHELARSYRKARWSAWKSWRRTVRVVGKAEELRTRGNSSFGGGGTVQRVTQSSQAVRRPLICVGVTVRIPTGAFDPLLVFATADGLTGS